MTANSCDYLLTLLGTLSNVSSISTVHLGGGNEGKEGESAQSAFGNVNGALGGVNHAACSTVLRERGVAHASVVASW